MAQSFSSSARSAAGEPGDMPLLGEGGTDCFSGVESTHTCRRKGGVSEIQLMKTDGKSPPTAASEHVVAVGLYLQHYKSLQQDRKRERYRATDKTHNVRRPDTRIVSNMTSG